MNQQQHRWERHKFKLDCKNQLKICMWTEEMSRLMGSFIAFVHNNSKLFTHHYRCLYAHSGEWSVEKLPAWRAELWQLAISQTLLSLQGNMLNVILSHQHTGAILKHPCAYLVQLSPRQNALWKIMVRYRFDCSMSWEVFMLVTAGAHKSQALKIKQWKATFTRMSTLLLCLQPATSGGMGLFVSL